MKQMEIERRLDGLERDMAEVKSALTRGTASARWWVESAGKFANDPDFD